MHHSHSRQLRSTKRGGGPTGLDMDTQQQEETCPGGGQPPWISGGLRQDYDQAPQWQVGERVPVQNSHICIYQEVGGPPEAPFKILDDIQADRLVHGGQSSSILATWRQIGNKMISKVFLKSILSKKQSEKPIIYPNSSTHLSLKQRINVLHAVHKVPLASERIRVCHRSHVQKAFCNQKFVQLIASGHDLEAHPLGKVGSPQMTALGKAMLVTAPMGCLEDCIAIGENFILRLEGRESIEGPDLVW